VKENSSFDVPFYREMVTGEPFPAVFWGLIKQILMNLK
jgi:hypothetical protein